MILFLVLYKSTQLGQNENLYDWSKNRFTILVISLSFSIKRNQKSWGLKLWF